MHQRRSIWIGRTVIFIDLFFLLVSVPDDPPGNIRAIGIEPTVLKAHWLPVSNETINGIGLGYKLALFTTNGTRIRDYTLNISKLSLEITGLNIWTNYSIKMAAFTIVGEGPWSELIVEDTDEEGNIQDDLFVYVLFRYICTHFRDPSKWLPPFAPFVFLNDPFWEFAHELISVDLLNDCPRIT